MQALFKAGHYAEAKARLLALLKHHPQNCLLWYNLACAQSRLRETDQALASLETAMENGFVDFRHMARDPDLKSLRDHPEFKRLMSRKDEFLRRAADARIKAIQNKYGDEFLTEVNHEDKIIYATSVGKQKLVQLKAFLSDYAKAQWEHLFTNRFDQYVTVVIPRPERLRDAKYSGFYSRWTRTLVARDVGPPVRHEFTHALHYTDQSALGQNHPTWICEGLATVFENARVVNGRAVPSGASVWSGFRKTLLKKHLPFERLARLGHSDFVKQSNTSYPQSHYIMLYLHKKGALERWYRAYTKGYRQEPTGLAAMSDVLGMTTDRIVSD